MTQSEPLPWLPPADTMHSLILVVLAAVALANAADPTLDAHWKDWKNCHSKSYGSLEEVLRREVWEDNLAIITKHNSEYSVGMHTFTMQINHIGDMVSVLTKFNV